MTQERFFNPDFDVFEEVFNTLRNRNKLSNVFYGLNARDILVDVMVDGNFLVVTLRDHINSLLSAGVSKRMYKDKFDFEVGFRIALRRALTFEPEYHVNGLDN